jgi:sugar (pentulose or hexulose) kinase
LHPESSIPVTAIFDIGKTNKKFLLFDSNFEVVYQQYTKMEEVEDRDDDGYPCENLQMLVRWVKDQLKTAVQNEDFDIQALNFSTYGASLVHLDDKGKVVAPFYDYLKPYPEKLLQQFYEAYGGKEQFALETASPPMGMLNSGLQLYWLKHSKSSLYKKISSTLHFPQYLSYLFTGKLTAEYTSIGCHTAMWNYEKNCYHRWLEEERMLHLLPEIQPVTQPQEINFNGKKLNPGIGIHDSSAALIPYLLAIDEPFLLLSTGTWSVALNPFNEDSLTFEELERDCLCFMNKNGDQVKAARFLLGGEYDYQNKKLEKYFGRDKQAMNIKPDFSLLKKLIKENSLSKKLWLEKAHTSGPFSSEKYREWDPNQFASYEEAYHQLMLDLITIQAASIKLVEGAKPINRIIVTGGFSQNLFFLKLLASRFPQKEICTTSLSHISALGAAVVINNSSQTRQKLWKLLNLKHHSPLKNTDMEQYIWKR